MSGIVVVETSATLSHLLQRTLGASQLSADRIVDSYPEAARLIDAIDRGGEPCRLMVLGAPQRNNREFEALLGLLVDGRAPRLPILVLAHEKTPFVSDMLSRRRNAFLLLWANFGRIPAAIRQLLPPEIPVVEATGPSPEVLTARPSGAPLKVLFVDDSQSVRLAFRELLENHGFIVDTAASLQEGLAKGSTGTYDLAILDYYLPDGNADELTRRLVALPATKQMPIAIITGSYKDAIIKRCLEAGAMDCLFKNEVLELTLARIKALARTIQTQKSVETERQRLDGILQSVGDGVYGVDGEGTISFANPAALKILGFASESELVGRDARTLIHGGESRDPTIARAYAEGLSLAGHETMFRGRDGGEIPVDCTVVPLAIGGRREGSVVVIRNIAERKSAERLSWELQHDPLTGLSNRRGLAQALASELERRRERGGYSAVLYIDIDRFNAIVDHAGARAADRALADVAQVLHQRMRQDDALARLESDHYAMLLSGVQLDNLFVLADGLREAIRGCKVHLFRRDVPVTASVGVAILSGDAPSAEYALEHARVACQEAKRRGRDQTQIYVAGADARIARELDTAWITRLKEALHEDRFRLLLQPILPVSAMAGIEEGALRRQGWRLHLRSEGEALFEVLIRMVSRDGSLVSPSVFVPLAERVGMMPKIDLWVVSRAVRLLSALPKTTRVVLTVNLSNATLQDPDSLKLIDGLVGDAGLPAGGLVFEVTETSEIDSLHSARRFVQSLRKRGVRFALDDFGTGFSSISHLKHLPVDFVKIEGSLVSDLGESSRDRTMVSSMVSLAHALELKVIAEHVDGAHTLRMVGECGADYAQGHLLGEPIIPEDIDLASLVRRS